MGIRAINLHVASATVVALAITSVPAFAQPSDAADERAAIQVLAGTWNGASFGASGHHFRIRGQEIQFENCAPLPFEFVVEGQWHGFRTITIKFPAPGPRFRCLWDGPILMFTFDHTMHQPGGAAASDRVLGATIEGYDSTADLKKDAVNSSQTYWYSP